MRPICVCDTWRPIGPGPNSCAGLKTCGPTAVLELRWTELCKTELLTGAGGDWPQVAHVSSSPRTAEIQRKTESNVHMAAMADAAVAVFETGKMRFWALNAPAD